MIALSVTLLFATAALAALGVTSSSLLQAWQRAAGLRDAAHASSTCQYYAIGAADTGRYFPRPEAEIIAFPQRRAQPCALREAA